MNIFGSSGIKQGIPNPPKPNVYKKQNKGEYEEYIDPNCGCRKIRKKKPKIKENESDIKIQSENEVLKPKNQEK